MKLNIVLILSFVTTVVSYGQESFDYSIFKTIGFELINESVNYEKKKEISSVQLLTDWETREKILDTVSVFSDTEKENLENKSEIELIEILDSKDYSFSDSQNHFYLLDTIGFFSDLHVINYKNKVFEIINQKREKIDYYVFYKYAFQDGVIIIALIKENETNEDLLNFYLQPKSNLRDFDLIDLTLVNFTNMKEHFGW